MKFVQLVFLMLTIQQSVFAEAPYESSTWKNLLYFDNSKSDVISPQWFTSLEKTAESEYNFLKNIFNSDDKSSLFCEFPARYLFIKKHLGEQGLHYLDKCHDLLTFEKQFTSKFISVAITSEYLNAPSSAFGHIMLVLHNNEVPEFDAKVVHYSALTRQVDFLQYSMNGLTGNFSGYFFQEPFFKKYNEYSNIEQRSIFIHPVKLSDDQKKLFIYHLYELKKARFKYYFLDKNCGYQISKLLQILFQTNEKSPAIYYLPSEVVQKNKDFLEEGIFLPSLSNRAQTSIEQLNDAEKEIFDKIIKNKPEALPLTNNLPNSIKKALLLYNQYQFRKKKNILANYFEIQSLSALEINKNAYELNPKKITSPLLKNASKRLGLKLAKFENNNKIATFLSFRPLLIDLQDFQNHNRTESNFNLVSSEFKFQDSILRLEKLDLIDLKVIYIAKKYFFEPSWFINSGLNRENNHENLSFSNDFGVGQSFDLKFIFSYFVGANLDFIELQKLDKHFVSTVNIIHYFNDDYKFLYEGKLKLKKHDAFYLHNFSIKKSWRTFNILAGYTKAKKAKQYLGIDYYF